MVQVFDTPINTNDQSLDRVLAAGLPLVLVFLSGQAPPDLELALQRAAREYSGQILFARIQVQDNPLAVRRYQIGRTPALVTVRKGQVDSRAEGFAAADLMAHIAYLLGKAPRPAQPDASTSRPASSTEARVRPDRTAETNVSPRKVTDATFDQEVLRSPLPVLVDFWAPWCGPCRMMEPAIEKLAQEMAGSLRVAKVNADENPMLVQRYRVQGIPTMMVVRDGRVVDQWVGALPEPMLRSRVKAFA